jgi:hypothetical protein
MRIYPPAAQILAFIVLRALSRSGRLDNLAAYSDDPTFRKEFQHIVEGARTAGLPERRLRNLRRTRVEARASPVLDSARIRTLGFPDKGDSSWPAFRSLRPA